MAFKKKNKVMLQDGLFDSYGFVHNNVWNLPYLMIVTNKLKQKDQKSKRRRTSDLHGSPNLSYIHRVAMIFHYDRKCTR